MPRTVELGVFMPVGSNGFLFSTYTPQYRPTFDLHKRIATISPLLFHPAVVAKMLATIDDVSDGRIGINIVTGNTLDEYEQMGMVPEGYNEYRYEYAHEWVDVLKRLWTEDKVTHDGRFFHLHDCVSRPKPVQKPHPFIVSAGVSDEGLGFAAKQADYAFIGLRPEEIAKVRRMAGEFGRSVKVCTNVFVLQGATDAAAEREFALIREHLDEEALDNLISSFNRDGRPSYELRTSYLRNPATVGFGSGTPVVGSAETVARKIAAMVIEGGMDGVQFTFVDFIEGLQAFGEDVLPILRGLLAREGIAVGERDLVPTY